MKKIVINQSYGGFFVSHMAFVRLRELGQREALQEVDLGAYWPQGMSPRDPSLNKHSPRHQPRRNWAQKGRNRNE